MVDANYIDSIPTPNTNILHNVPTYDLTARLSNFHSENETANLILNSNLDDYGIIK